jgi:hypothetical protein
MSRRKLSAKGTTASAGSAGRSELGTTHVGVRMWPKQLAALDAWIARHPDPKPTRSEAIRQILAEHLSSQGHLRSRPDLRKRRDGEPPRGNIQVADAEMATSDPVGIAPADATRL